MTFLLFRLVPPTPYFTAPATLKDNAQVIPNGQTTHCNNLLSLRRCRKN
jgi:hypothetical protein